MKISIYFCMLVAMLVISGCGSEVGSKAWCDEMNNKPKGDWTVNEAGEYAKNCVFSSDE